MKQLFAEKSGIVVGRSSKSLAIIAVGLLSTGLFASRASATTIYTLGVGQGNNSPSATGYPVGGTLVSSYTNPFTASSGGLTIQGTVTSDVISGDTSNPYGGYTFEYLLTLTGVNDVVGGMSAIGFAGFQTDVSYNPNMLVGGIAPSSFSRSSAINNGTTLTFVWSPNISPGQSGDWIIVQTDAHNFGLGTGNVMDGEGTGISVLTPVPEPQIASLAVMGLGALFLFRRRNSK